MMTKASMLSRPGKVKQKDFKPKNNLPRLDDYSVDLPQSYWDKWNKLTFSEANYSSWLDPKEFFKVAEETGFNNMKHVEFVSNYLTEGAKIGWQKYFEFNRNIICFSGSFNLEKRQDFIGYDC